jgi:nitroreductase
MTWRYGERGYRDLHLDAGHVCQNLYLAAEAVGCGVCAMLHSMTIVCMSCSGSMVRISS